ncbi:hypothetical protein PPACK8108_LOCUS3377 [Phakopsora pachyrhizi]|uniref:HECT domain-containing protein n=1 Tax=Phakopsora pachyrhizi TaxID=170000 RepID=A0AAV0AL39_PHAPC|nr:hypothetical protein PPACK8108_LOCUS3377 [Phakopsora pachyrhizi]
MLLRQLKIRLVAAKGTDVPKNWANVVHKMMSGMLAAFAAVAGLPAASSSSQTSQIEEGGTRSSSDLWSDICRYPNKFPCTSTEFKIKWAPSSSVALSSSAPEELMEIDITRRDQMELDNQQVGVGPIDQELEPRSPSHNSPVSIQPAQDGSKMEAHTPHGTRISTPLNSRSTSCSSRPLYAAAVKSEPKDWHLAFSLVDGLVPVSNKDASSPDPGSREEGPGIPASILEGLQQASILRLLRALHGLNLDWSEFRKTNEDPSADLALPETIFINNKLTAKLNQQLEEPMIVASACLPDWACDLPQQFPFIFPFETSWQKILESLIYKVFELYSSCWAMLEVEYFDEYMMWCNHDTASLEHLSKYVVKKQAIEADGGLTESERDGAIRQIRVDGAKVEDLAVEFVLPGYDIEMNPDGTETVVTIDNVKEFIDLVISWTLSKGVICQVKMFKSGLSILGYKNGTTCGWTNTVVTTNYAKEFNDHQEPIDETEQHINGFMKSDIIHIKNIPKNLTRNEIEEKISSFKPFQQALIMVCYFFLPF